VHVDLLALAVQATEATQDPFWERFLLSPGFGGASALVAGVLAYAAANRKAGYDRQAARQKQWWDALAWVYDRATAERPGARLNADLALNLLDRLEAEAQTDLEIQTVAGLLEELFQDESEAEDVDAPHQADPTSSGQVGQPGGS
jgi:hypothetical protein